MRREIFEVELKLDPILQKEWPVYIRESKGTWRKYHSQFTSAYVEMGNAFLKWLAKQPGSKEKIVKLYGIKNKKAYPKLLKGI